MNASPSVESSSTRLAGCFPAYSGQLTVLLFGLFLVSRLFWLDMRPPHFDEGVNAWWLGQMQLSGYYAYNPADYHGPLFFYLTFGLTRFLGDGLWVLRGSAVLASFITALCLWGFRPVLGRSLTCWAMGLMVVSPGLWVYSRTAIHEPWVMAGAALTMLSLYRLLLGPAETSLTSPARRAWWVWGLVAGVVGLLATKETWPMLLAVMGGATLVAPPVEVAEPSSWAGVARNLTQRLGQGNRGLWLRAASVGLVVLVLLYTGCLSAHGGLGHPLQMTVVSLLNVLDSFQAWVGRGVADADHVKPWFYYGWLFFRAEGALLLGVGAGMGLFRTAAPTPALRLIRWVWVYAMGLVLAFSMLPYKTPWNSIQWLWPLCISGGWVVNHVWQRFLVCMD
ncbi:MAG: hypothetical protein KC474_11170, partial [Cyanobacteria bacterium HKST-UBA04]|nr:hypothetical protein [Cyanobacteria bacterium HKST-UBA04]